MWKKSFLFISNFCKIIRLRSIVFIQLLLHSVQQFCCWRWFLGILQLLLSKRLTDFEFQIQWLWSMVEFSFIYPRGPIHIQFNGAFLAMDSPDYPWVYFTDLYTDLAKIYFTVVFLWNSTLREEFNFYFSRIFCYYWQNFNFGSKTEHQAIILWNFKIFFIFPNFLRS